MNCTVTERSLISSNEYVDEASCSLLPSLSSPTRAPTPAPSVAEGHRPKEDGVNLIVAVGGACVGFVLLVLGTVACVMYSRKAKSKPELLGIAMSVQSPIGQAGRVDEPAAAAADAKPPPPAASAPAPAPSRPGLDDSPSEFGFDDTYPSGSTRVPPPLPPGWIENKDPTSGQMYFHNATTGESTWERPLVERWVAAKDKATGAVFYYEKTTGRSSWTEHVP